MVLAVVALIVQRMEGFMLNLPPRPTTPHEVEDGALAHPQVRHPTAVLDLRLADLPVLDELDPYLCVRCMERHVIDKSTTMDETCGAVVPLRRGDTSGVLRDLHLRAQIGLIACVAPKDIVTIVVVEGLDVGGMGTQPVCSDTALELGVVLAQLDHEAYGGMAFTIIFVRALVLHERFGHHGHHGTAVRMEHRRAQHLVSIRDRPVAVGLVQARGTVNGLGGKRARAIEGQERVAIKQRHRCTGLAAVALPKDAFEHGTSRLRGDRIESRAQMRIARDPLQAVDGVPMVLDPFLIKGKQGRRLEGHHGARRPARSG